MNQPAEIDTRRVTGRRKLRFNSLDDLLADARGLVGKPVRALGNWTLAQNLRHLEQTMTAFMDRVELGRPAWWERLLGRTLKSYFLNGNLPAGYQLPNPALDPEPQITIAQSLWGLETAVARWNSAEPLPTDHPFFGPMTREDWIKLHLRHAELHLSFIVDDGGISAN